MALIVEDGTGLSNAEAFISVDDATTYLAARGSADAWDAIEDKEAALRLAADYMLQQYRMRWAGYRNSETQALDWPRQLCPNPDFSGYSYIANTVVPNDVKYANALLALKTASGDLLADQAPFAVEKTVGPLTVKYAEHTNPATKYAAVEMLLAPYFVSSGNMAKLVRV